MNRLGYALNAELHKTSPGDAARLTVAQLQPGSKIAQAKRMRAQLHLKGSPCGLAEAALLFVTSGFATSKKKQEMQSEIALASGL